jgi:hypothetical protein
MSMLSFEPYMMAASPITFFVIAIALFTVPIHLILDGTLTPAVDNL